MAVGKGEILAEIRRTAAENGGQVLGRKRFAEATGIQESDWTGRYWARWSDAVVEAGFEPNQLQGRFNDDDVLAALIPEIRRHGRLPTRAELRLRRQEDRNFPSHNVYAKFGSRRDLAGLVAEYCERRGDCADVIGALQPILAEEEPAADPGTEPVWGCVYLLKSGRYYKIGRTNSLVRRERELEIQLPERATRVHELNTDDPVGIERYWHLRFSDRRRNGEWFELTAADVRAFKKRKSFM